MNKRKIIDEIYGKPRKGQTTNFIAHFPDLIDIVLNDYEAKFLLSNGDIWPDKEYNGILYQPPPIERLGFSLPDYEGIKEASLRHSGVSGDYGVSEGLSQNQKKAKCYEDEVLCKKLLNYYKESAELPDDRLYLLLVSWVFHTHLLEKFEYSPIIFFAGLPEKGKSRMAKAMIATARRGIVKASVTDAQLIREASDHQATLFFDTTDFEKSMDKSGSMDIILSRYERGLKVGRVKDYQKGPFQDMVYYDVFGPTIISSNQTIETVLGSRTLTIIMRQAIRKIKKHVDFVYGNQLRNELIAWRLKHFNDILLEPNRIISGRLGDIVEPLHQIILKVYPESENDFVDIVKELEKKRYIAKADSLEGETIQAILALEDYIVNGILAVKLITDKVNEEKSEKEKITYQKMGRKLDIMGFTKAKTGTGTSAIEWNEKLNESLAIEHNILKETQVPSEIQEITETPEM